MAPAMEKRTKVRVSKNRKKAWGKHCDIKDVEDFLEDQRFDERTGGPIYDKPNEELFFLDTSTELAKTKSKVEKSIKTLKCHENLGLYSKVPPPVNSLKLPIGKKKKKLLEKVEAKKLKKFLAHGDQNQQKTSTLKFHDLWADVVKKNDPELEELIFHRDEVTKKRPVKVPSHLYQKPSLLPAVEVPHPGASYNPSYSDHQDLLLQAVQIEQKKEKEEMHLKRVLCDMFPTKAEAPTEKTRMEEMSQGLFDDDPKEETEFIDARLYANPPVTDDDRKTKSKHRRQKELKQQLRMQALEKQAKHKINDIYRIKTMKAEIREAEKLTAERQAKKQEREIEKMYKPRTLSKYKFEPNDLEVNLKEDLPESMRILKVEGNLFEDRYKSLQKRNIIEPRIRQKRKRKYKLKVQVKRSHRDFQ